VRIIGRAAQLWRDPGIRIEDEKPMKEWVSPAEYMDEERTTRLVLG